MRIAIVSPYSWTYAGGVNRHVEALAEALIARGPRAQCSGPVGSTGSPQPDAPPRARGPKGTSRLPDPARANGRFRRQRRRLEPVGVSGCRDPLRRELNAGRFDVVHVHEPLAPMLGWDACSFPGAPGRRHLPRLLDQATAEHIAKLLAPAGSSTGSRPASPSPRPPPGPDGAGSAASTDHPQRGRRRRAAARPEA